jgi:A/G-specific adenine glycosylase
VKKYPHVQALAKAERRSLQHLLNPLGIKSRVSDLLGLAKRIEKEECGEIPSSYGKLVKLPGVGRYIANSVLVKAYGEKLPLVDSNVNRVLSRLFQASSHINDENAERLFMSVAKYVDPVRLNYAVIDLAHTICTYATPRCPSCPLGRSCRYALSRD